MEFGVPGGLKVDVQVQFDWFILALRADLSERVNRSTRPFASGWYAVVLIILLSKSFISWLNRPDTNCFPLSEVITAGTHETHLATKAFAVVYAAISLMGRASHQQEKRSTHVSKYDWLSHMGNGPLMSICTWENRSSGNGKDPGGEQMCFLTLTFWYDTQAFAHRRMSVHIRGYINLSCGVLMCYPPGCDRLCMGETNVLHNVSGTHSFCAGIIHNFQIPVQNRYPRQFQRSGVVLKMLQLLVISLFLHKILVFHTRVQQKSINATRHGLCRYVVLFFEKTDIWSELQQIIQMSRFMRWVPVRTLLESALQRLRVDQDIENPSL